LQLSGETMRRAITNPTRYTPEKAPPLFRDPSRFLGQWDDPRFIRASKEKACGRRPLCRNPEGRF
jgi:hypothetical protein